VCVCSHPLRAPLAAAAARCICPKEKKYNASTPYYCGLTTTARAGAIIVNAECNQDILTVASERDDWPSLSDCDINAAVAAIPGFWLPRLHSSCGVPYNL
jgi:hypothetical protein